jgi:hypothetical protein
MAEVLDLLGDNILDDLNTKQDDGDEEFWCLKLRDNFRGIMINWLVFINKNYMLEIFVYNYNCSLF